MQPVMITAAMVGAEVTKAQQPYLPITLQEIIAAAELFKYTPLRSVGVGEGVFMNNRQLVETFARLLRDYGIVPEILQLERYH